MLPGRADQLLLLMAATDARRAVLNRRVQLLVAYSVVEATIALTEGTRVSSAALIGFGLDSVVEISSAPRSHGSSRPATRNPGRRPPCGSSPSRSTLWPLLCTYLSAVLLGGLLLNGLLGWSWADPVAALGIAALAMREGRNAWRGDPCCR